MNPYYREYSDLLAEIFGPDKIQKISVDLALGCPNRDGTLGRGGCIYCDNRAFSPDAEKVSLPVAEQLRRGKAFFSRKYSKMRYLAYFQSYTGTYGRIPMLLDAYSEALADTEVAGLVIGTRPDCMPDALLDSLQTLSAQTSKPILIEYGVETSHDTTLTAINRHHTYACAADAIRRTAARGMPVGVHLIMGLPGETRAMMLDTIDAIAALPVASIKLHQMQILTGTALHSRMLEGTMPPVENFTPESYASLCADIVERLPHSIAIDRFVASAPADMLVYPRWGLKNYQFTTLVLRELERRGTNK